MKSCKGQLLIASRKLRDSNFAKTVVLIVQHDEQGAMGLVLNRPLDVSIAEACGESVEAAEEVQAPVHEGGPCPGPLMVLYASDAPEEMTVVPGVSFTAQRDEIETLMREGSKPIKYFANYSGWAAKQLESELAEGAWRLTPAAAADVFATDGDSQWKRILARLNLGHWIDPEQIPEDPSMN